MTFNTTALLLTLTIIFFGGSASAHGIGNESAGEACRARPASAPHSDGRWMYRINRTSGEKCWFWADSRKPANRRHIPILAYDDTESVDAKSQSSNCARSPSGPARANTQWRYQVDVEGQKCWRLVGTTSKRPAKARMQVASSNESNEIKRGHPGLLQLFVNASARLAEAKSVLPEGRANPDEGSSSKEALSETYSTTFENRWIDSTEMRQPPNLSASAFSAYADANRPAVVRHSSPRGSITANSETTFRLLLLATVASIGIAVGLVPRDLGSEP
jgi:hypothetical protein